MTNLMIFNKRAVALESKGLKFGVDFSICEACGSILRSKRSIALGLGPSCYKAQRDRERQFEATFAGQEAA